MTLRIGGQINYVTQALIPKFIEGNQFNVSYIVRLVFPSLNGDSHMDLIPLYVIQILGLFYIISQIMKVRAESSDQIYKN